jgi:hypothetical protein
LTIAVDAEPSYHALAAVITQGRERRVEKTGEQGKAVKRLINTKVIYPPADGTAEVLLASSSINLADRTKSIGI